MPITFSCECGKRLKTPDDWGGRWVRCTACKRELLVPLPEDRDFALDAEPARAAPAPAPPPAWQPIAHADDPPPRPVIAAPPPGLEHQDRTWRGYVFWLLLAAMIPLWIDVFRSGDETLRRIRETIRGDAQLNETYGQLDDDELGMELAVNEEDFFKSLPNQRILGALHGKYTLVHWLYALAAAGVFLAFVSFALPGLPAKPWHLALAGLFTGTLGMVLLTIIQLFGMFCFCCLGAMYLAALDPDAPFGASLLGFFLGVGLCEELIKSLPVMWRLYRPIPAGWREACLWGMASGAGFGVSEAVHYAGNYYNGIEPAAMYVVRFVSCVSLHVMLSGACGILLQRHQHHLEAETDYFEWGITFLAIITVPMFLHGLFNTVAKKDMPIGQIVLAGMAFAWLAYLIGSSRRRESGITQAVASMPVVVRTAHGTRIVQR